MTERKSEIRALTAAEFELVAGGRKAGESPKEYLVVTLKEVFVTGVTVPSTNPGSV